MLTTGTKKGQNQDSTIQSTSKMKYKQVGHIFIFSLHGEINLILTTQEE